MLIFTVETDFYRSVKSAPNTAIGEEQIDCQYRGRGIDRQESWRLRARWVGG